MTQEEFKKILKENKIKFSKEGKTIVVSKESGYVSLDALTTLPRDVRFENKGWVSLSSLTTPLPRDVRFDNKGGVWLNSLTTLPRGMRFDSKATRFNPIFRNKGRIYLISYHNKTKRIPQDQDQHGTKIIFEQ